ncbi:MAG: nuclear transport factor 2 family protein [Candidatus Acidiferrales bacterium]
MSELGDAGFDKQKELAAVNDLYSRWCKAWLSFPDTTLMLSLYDKEFDGMLYTAEEIPSGLLTYKDIAAYWHNAHNLLASVTDWTEMAKSVSFLSPTAGIIWAEVMTALTTTVMPEKIVGKLRCSIGVRKGKQGWAIVHYHESRQLLAAADKAGKWSFFVDLTIK